jgi:hypothetical protein
MASHAAAADRRRDRFFYVGIAVAAAVIVFVGFSRTYFLKAHFGTPPLSRLLHLHGLVFTSWIVLLLTQVSLVAARRTDLHRRLGVLGVLLAPLMVAIGLTAAIDAARRGSAPPGGPPPLVFLAIPFGDMAVFAILVAAGFYFRRRPDAHKRLMLVATIGLLTAAIARLPFAFILGTGPPAFFGLTDLVLAVCILYDYRARRRVHPAYLWGGLLLVASQPLRLVVAGTNAWLAFAGWLTRI